MEIPDAVLRLLEQPPSRLEALDPRGHPWLVVVDDAIWEAVSYLPGRVLGLHEIGHRSANTCVLHGDCTVVANLLVDERVQEVVAMIDFALARVGPPESDISFALWS